MQLKRVQEALQIAKALGGIIVVLGSLVFFGVCTTHHSVPIKLSSIILLGIPPLLGFYIFIRSDRRIKELKKADESAAKKIKQGISWKTKLIISIIILLLLVLTLFDI